MASTSPFRPDNNTQGIHVNSSAYESRLKYLMDPPQPYAHKRMRGSVFYGVPSEVTAEREKREWMLLEAYEKADQERHVAEDKQVCVDRFIRERVCVQGPNVLRVTDLVVAFRDWYRDEGLGEVAPIGIISCLRGELTARYPDRARFRKQRGDGWLGLAIVGEEDDTEELVLDDFIYEGKLYLKDTDGRLYDPVTMEELDPVAPLSAPATQSPSCAPGALSVLPYGKHQGGTFASIARADPQYCGWVLQQATCPGVFREFQDYLTQKLAQ